MTTQHSSPAPLVFGPFEVNAHTGELRKGGVRVRLSGQPFQILLLLLAKPGDLVTREELREQLWSDGTFVDFEHGLNAAINKLRRALGDSAEHPRYIETATGRGYVSSEPSSESPMLFVPADQLPKSCAGVASTGASRAIRRDTYPIVDRETDSKAHARRRDRPRPWA